MGAAGLRWKGLGEKKTHYTAMDPSGQVPWVAELARVLGLTLRKLLPAAPRAEGAKPAGAGLDFTFPPKQ